MHSAASNGHLAVVKYLITELGCDPQIGDNDGLTPLGAACLEGHLDTVKHLITECNCNPNSCDNFGSSPPSDLSILLFTSCLYGYLDIVKFLIEECGCDPHYTDENGLSLLHATCTDACKAFAHGRL